MEDERVTDGPVVAVKQSNVRGAVRREKALVHSGESPARELVRSTR